MMERQSQLDGGQKFARSRALLIRLLWIVFLVQAVAAPIALWVKCYPQANGVLFSYAVSFPATINSMLFGVAVSNVVLIPFIFVWSPRTLRWRLAFVATVFVSILLATFCLSLMVRILIPSIGPVSARQEFWRQMGSVIVDYGLLSLGIAVSPLLIKVLRGWHLARQQETADVVAIFQRRNEFFVLAGILLACFVIPQFFNLQDGLFPITVIGGAAIGLFVFLSGSCIFRTQKHLGALIAIPCFAMVLVGVPWVVYWFHGMWGALWGTVSLCASLFATLLLEAIILRCLGYRLVRYKSEKSVLAAEKPVVDPFSD